MFTEFLFSLRAHGLPVGLNEWMAFLTGLRRGVATDIDGMYGFGRSILCRTEADYDAFDLAFGSFFEGRIMTPEIREELLFGWRRRLGPTTVNWLTPSSQMKTFFVSF